MTNRQTDLKLKQIETRINKELSYVYGLEEDVDSLKKKCRNIICETIEETFPHYYFGAASISFRGGHCKIYIKNIKFKFFIYMHQATYEDSSELLRDGLIPSLRRKSFLKDYRYLLDNELIEDNTLTIFFVGASQ